MEHSKNGSRTKKCAGKALLRWYDEQEWDLKLFLIQLLTKWSWRRQEMNKEEQS